MITLNADKLTLKKVKREFRVLMVGLDGAGKTTLMRRMKTNEFVPSYPTIGFNVEMVHVERSLHVTVWDVGGGAHIRKLWKYYMDNKQAIVFVVDASDRERISEARDTLHDVLREHQLRNCLLLVMGTKKDVVGAMDGKELTSLLKMGDIRNRKHYLILCDSESGVGAQEGLDWLTKTAHAKNEISQ